MNTPLFKSIRAVVVVGLLGLTLWAQAKGDVSMIGQSISSNIYENSGSESLAGKNMIAVWIAVPFCYNISFPITVTLEIPEEPYIKYDVSQSCSDSGLSGDTGGERGEIQEYIRGE